MSYKKVRLSDIAKATHVSKATVSAVLNGKTSGSIRASQATKDLVLETARQMGYVPNQAARNLKQGYANVIAVFTYEDIFPVESQTEFYDFFVGIQEEAEALGFDLLILNTKKNLPSSRLTIATGAVMIGVNRNDQDIKALAAQEFPLVFVGRRAIDELQTHWVTFDYRRVIEMVFPLSINKKNKGVLLLRQKNAISEPSLDKEKAIREFSAELNLPVRLMEIDDTIPEEIATLAKEQWFIFLDRLFMAPRIDAFLKERGLTINENCAGFLLEDDWLGTHTRWPHWSNERRELGKLAVTHLKAMIEGEATDSLPSLVPLRIVPGETVQAQR